MQALRIIKHLSTKGCSQFQRCMQRHSTCVRYEGWLLIHSYIWSCLPIRFQHYMQACS